MSSDLVREQPPTEGARSPTPPASPAFRLRLSRVPPTMLVAVCFLRLFLALAAHALTAAGMHHAGVPSAWAEAGKWMTVWGTAVDLGTLAVLTLLLKREGYTLVDLYRAAPARWGDVPLAFGLLVVLGVAGFTGGALSGLVFYGTPTPPPPFGHLPLWAGLYSTLVWPLVWGFTEEATYNGYAAPRLASLWGRRSALILVSIGWAAQHMALPAYLDPAFAGYRFFSSLPIALIAVPFYLRTGRLLPLALAHVVIDMLSGSLTLLPP